MNHAAAAFAHFSNGIGKQNQSRNQQLSALLLLLSFASYAAAQSSTACAGLSVGGSSNIGSCTCNLLYNWCDTDCCCDPDCSQQQTAMFSSCITQAAANPQLCTSNSSFGCLYFDNYPARLYYATKPITCDSTTFQLNLTQYASTYTFQPQVPTLPALATFYRPGDPLYMVSAGSSVDYFVVPRAAGTSSICVDSVPAAYLVGQSTSCNRPLATTAACASTAALSAQTYCSGVTFLSQPPPSNCASLSVSACIAAATTVSNTSFQIATSTGLLTCATAPTPSYNATTGLCSNVVTQVAYSVTHNYQSGIQTIQAVITLGSVLLSATASPSALANQQFTISFTPTGLSFPNIPRSGNPGYVVGQPVLAGLPSTDNSTGLPYIATPSNPYTQLTVLSPLGSSSSSCLQCIANGNCFQPVLFGINYRSGCVVNMTFNNYTSNCNDVSTLLQTMLWPWNSTLVRVAALGNYTTDQVGGYVPIQLVNNVQARSGSDGLCSNMITGLSLQFMYQRTNTLANPQMRIVGAQYQYLTQTVSLRCITPYCNANTLGTATLPLEVKVVVTFVDISQPATLLQKLRPIFLAKLPYNFFYPFGLSAASSNTVCITTLLFSTIFALYFKP